MHHNPKKTRLIIRTPPQYGSCVDPRTLLSLDFCTKPRQEHPMRTLGRLGWRRAHSEVQPIGAILGVSWGLGGLGFRVYSCMGIMENKMETTILYIYILWKCKSEQQTTVTMMVRTVPILLKAIRITVILTVRKPRPFLHPDQGLRRCIGAPTGLQLRAALVGLSKFFGLRKTFRLAMHSQWSFYTMENNVACA